MGSLHFHCSCSSTDVDVHVSHFDLNVSTRQSCNSMTRLFTSNIFSRCMNGASSILCMNVSAWTKGLHHDHMHLSKDGLSQAVSIQGLSSGLSAAQRLVAGLPGRLQRLQLRVQVRPLPPVRHMPRLPHAITSAAQLHDMSTESTVHTLGRAFQDTSLSCGRCGAPY